MKPRHYYTVRTPDSTDHGGNGHTRKVDLVRTSATGVERRMCVAVVRRQSEREAFEVANRLLIVLSESTGATPPKSLDPNQ